MTAHPVVYRHARQALLAVTDAALTVYLLVPVAPPRMLPGFVDTAAVLGQSVYGEADASALVNQYAALASLHVGWAALVAVACIGAASNRWRWLWLLHPVVTVLVVVGTASHFWLDAGAAAAWLPRPGQRPDADRAPQGRNPAVHRYLDVIDSLVHHRCMRASPDAASPAPPLAAANKLVDSGSVGNRREILALPTEADLARADSLTREIFSDVANKWALLMIESLAQRTMRFSELRDEVGGISHKMLTQNLRMLERNGLVQRTVHPTVPPRVEYNLTEAGDGLRTVTDSMCGWTQRYLGHIEASRSRFPDLTG